MNALRFPFTTRAILWGTLTLGALASCKNNETDVKADAEGGGRVPLVCRNKQYWLLAFGKAEKASASGGARPFTVNAAVGSCNRDEADLSEGWGTVNGSTKTQYAYLDDNAGGDFVPSAENRWQFEIENDGTVYLARSGKRIRVAKAEVASEGARMRPDPAVKVMAIYVKRDGQYKLYKTDPDGSTPFDKRYLRMRVSP